MNKYMYVDLITLLPPPATTTGNETKDKKPATTESFDQWLEAWSAHEKTYLTNPARYAELAQYRSIIQKANWKFRWKAVYDFDVQFWTSLSGTTKQLDQIDSTLYTTILDSSAVRAEGTSCQHCKSDHHLVWDCSFRTKQTLESKVCNHWIFWPMARSLVCARKNILNQSSEVCGACSISQHYPKG